MNNYKVDSSQPIKIFEAKIYLKEEVTPKFIKARQVPLAHQTLVEEASSDFVDNNVIEPASPIVPVFKIKW